MQPQSRTSNTGVPTDGVYSFATTIGYCNSSSGGGSVEVVAGGGGPSAVYPKPSWQTGFAGIQNDGVRDIPDVSLFAGDGFWSHSYVVCDSDPSFYPKGSTHSPCNLVPDNPNQWWLGGGTSFASPMMAGIQALINQMWGGAQGNPNAVYYALAGDQYEQAWSSSCASSNGDSVSPSCIFYDVTIGDIDVPVEQVAKIVTKKLLAQSVRWPFLRAPFHRRSRHS